MKLSVRPLKGEAITIEADPEEKVEDIKKKIADARPEFPADLQKLIHAGKILADGTCIKDYNIKEGEFLVVMAAKAKPPATSGADTNAAAPAPAAAAPTEPAAAPPAGARAQPAAQLSEAAVTQLCDMGFPRGEVERALRAAFGNPDRAVEYLTTGIPEGAPQAPPGATAPMAVGGGGGGGGLAFPAMPTGTGGGGGRAAAALEELRNLPRFEELAALVAQNPAMLNQILGALQTTHPELVQTITENQEEFLAMLQDSLGGDEDDEGDEGLGGMYGDGGGEGDEGGAAIQLTGAEQSAIERLAALGFDRRQALEAYLACDGNEDLAANLLFDTMNDAEG